MKIVFAGNCQAYALCFLYERHIGAARGQTIGWVDAWNEHRLEDWKAELAGADLLIIQVFSGASRTPVAELSGDTPKIVFPDVRGNFLWPYGNVSRPGNPQPSYKGGGPYDTEVGDAYLNKMIEADVSPAEALARYVELDVARDAHLDRIFELTLDQQRRRDAQTGFAIADHVESRFRTERLFNTQGHLSLSLFHHLAAEVYGRIGATDAEIETVRRSVRRSPFEPFHDAPIHPNVIAHFQMTCVSDATGWHHVQEGRFSFAERVRRYMTNTWSPELHEGFEAANQGDWLRALALIERGLETAPGSAYGHNRRGEVLERLGRYEDALEATRRARDLEPHDAEIGARYDHVRRLASAAPPQGAGSTPMAAVSA